MKEDCLKKPQVGLFGSRLLAMCCRMFFVGYGLVMLILGGYARGLVILSAAVHIRLL